MVLEGRQGACHRAIGWMMDCRCRGMSNLVMVVGLLDCWRIVGGSDKFWGNVVTPLMLVVAASAFTKVDILEVERL